MDELYTKSPNEARTSVDARDVFRGSNILMPSSLRMLYVDEFTTSLLVNFMDENSAFFVALAGWGISHPLDGLQYGYGDVTYYLPDEVKRVSLQLNAEPEMLLVERFREQADNYRSASSGYLDDDTAILTHQRTFADLLRRLYHEAGRDGDFVLLLMV